MKTEIDFFPAVLTTLRVSIMECHLALVMINISRTEPTVNLYSLEISFSLGYYFTLKRKQRKCSSSRLLLGTCKQLSKTHMYEHIFPFILFAISYAVCRFFFCSSYSKLMLLVVLLSIHKYALKFRVCHRDRQVRFFV